MNRIRRTPNEIDLVFRNDLPKKFPMLQELSASDEQLRLRIHRTRWEFLDPECDCVEQRTISAVLEVEGVHAGSFRLYELRLEPLIDKHEFYYWADTISSAKAELASVLCRHWEELSELADYGSIVEFERTWMSPRFASVSRFKAAMNSLMRIVPDHSIILLKAYPLEYEGAVTQDNRVAHQRRQNALIRFYRSTAGVSAFPGAAGGDGWMYSIPERLRSVVPAPIEQK